MKKLIIIIAMLLPLLVGAQSNTGSDCAPLAWDPPTTNADGTQCTDLAGFKVYWGDRSGNYSHSKDVGNVLTASICGPGSFDKPGDWYFAVTAYDTSGNESTFSSEVKKSI